MHSRLQRDPYFLAVANHCYLQLSFRWRESFVFDYIIQILYFNLQDPTSSLASPARLRSSRFARLWRSGPTENIDVIYLQDPFATLVPPKDSSNPSPMKLSPPSKVLLQDPTFGIRTSPEELHTRAYSRSPLSRCFETVTFLPTVDLPNSFDMEFSSPSKAKASTIRNIKISNADIYCLIYHGRVSHLASLQMLKFNIQDHRHSDIRCRICNSWICRRYRECLHCEWHCP